MQQELHGTCKLSIWHRAKCKSVDSENSLEEPRNADTVVAPSVQFQNCTINNYFKGQMEH